MYFNKTTKIIMAGYPNVVSIYIYKTDGTEIVDHETKILVERANGGNDYYKVDSVAVVDSAAVDTATNY